MGDLNDISGTDKSLKKEFDRESEKKRLEATGKYPDFHGNPDLEKELHNSLEKAKSLPESEANIKRIKEVNDYILDIDKKCLELSTNEKITEFLKQELDVLTGQRKK